MEWGLDPAGESGTLEGTILKIVCRPDGQTLSFVVILGGGAKS